MQKIVKISLNTSAALTALAALGNSAAYAQMPPPPPPPAHHGFLHNMFHHPKPGQAMPGRPMPGHPMYNRPMPGRPMMGGGMSGMSGGSIVGNKNTHVYHMAGDRGAMPAPQNRVYFRSMREAEAAGYRRAGSTMGSHSMHPTMHGSPINGTPGMMRR